MTCNFRNVYGSALSWPASLFSEDLCECRFHVCDGSALTSAFMGQEGLLPAENSQSAAGSADRLQEKQIDLMQLLQGLQNGAAANQFATQ